MRSKKSRKQLVIRREKVGACTGADLPIGCADRGNTKAEASAPKRGSAAAAAESDRGKLRSAPLGCCRSTSARVGELSCEFGLSEAS